MSNNYRFLNPYNFVRYLPKGREDGTPEIKLLGRCAPPPHDRFVGITGRIECALEVVTPIFISDSEFVEDKGNEHKSYRFFRLKNENGEEEFAIPSTSLRGMLRSVFEAATNSCFSVFEGGLLGKRERPENYEKTLLTAGLIVEIPKSKDKPGSVMKMKYYKLPHNKFPQYKNNFKRNGEKILVKINNDKVFDMKEYNENDNISEGYVLSYLKTSDRGLPGRTQKINEYVFVVEDGSSEHFKLSYETYQNYVIANRNNKHGHTKVPKSGDTIWFRHEAKKIKEFGYAQIYRKPFGKSISELLPQSFHLCSDYNNLCPACRLFGWIHPLSTEDLKVKVAYAGRIKISYAQILDNKDPLEEFPLAILSAPKPTTTFFYLLKDGKPDFYVTYNANGAQLRGRKFYRHQTEAKEQEYKRAGNIKDDQNRTIRDALNPGAKFGFTVEFENLSPVEFGALLWSIEMENGMFHKLGLGKPLGFGSIKLSIKNISTINIKERYNSFKDNGWKTLNDTKKIECINLFKEAMKNKYNKDFDKLDNIKDIKAVLSKSALAVHYPRTLERPDPEGKNFEWFMQNKRSKKGMPLDIASEDTNGFPLKFMSDRK